jgi:hypothetical protein
MLDWVSRLRGRRIVPGTSLVHLLDRAPEFGLGAFADNRKTKVISTAYRAMAFEAARAVAPCSARPDSLSPSSKEWRFMQIEMTSGSQKDDVAAIHQRDIRQIYKSIRRHFEHRYLRGRRRVVRDLRELEVEPITQPILEADPLVCAFMWWRQHFELYSRRPSADELRTLLYFASNPHLQVENFFRKAILRYFDLPRNATSLHFSALLFAASFYRACWETLARCREIGGAANDWPSGRRRNSDRSSIFDDNFDRQVLSPCWTRILFRDTNADARMVRQIGTLTATAEVVLALGNWRWARLSEADQGPLH